MKKEVKISFNQQRWSSEGTHYRGTFAITREQYEAFKEYIKNTSEKIKDYMSKVYAQEPLKEEEGEIVFLNLTQTTMLIVFLTKNNIEFNIDRALKEINYCLKIKN